jgi:acetyl-CoA carboxylase biotin carboxyl carrier protein
MKTKEIRDLIEFISQTGLNEVKIETEELKISIKRDPDVQTRVIENSSAPFSAAPMQVAAPTSSTATAPAETADAPASSKYVEIRTPMIGTFYRSPNPDSPSFVNVGDKVEKGQPVCIIEAMKLFNEIESEVSGTIVKAVAENASPVEYDQVLFLVDPS